MKMSAIEKARQLPSTFGFQPFMHLNGDGPGIGQPESGEGASASRSLFDPGKRGLRILVVDDETLIADTLARILNLSGFVATATYSGQAALELAPRFCPDIVLSDIRMPGLDGIETGRSIRELFPKTRVVLFSGQAGIGDVSGDRQETADNFEVWRKPIHPRELVRRLHEI